MTETVEATIADLLLARLGALPEQTPPIDIAYAGVPFTPTPGKTYVAGDIVMNSNVNLGVSHTSTTEFRGIFQVSVKAPSTGGIIAPLELAGRIANHFERGTAMEGNGLIVRVRGRPSVGSARPDADRTTVPVSVSFFAFA